MSQINGAIFGGYNLGQFTGGASPLSPSLYFSDQPVPNEAKKPELGIPETVSKQYASLTPIRMAGPGSIAQLAGAAGVGGAGWGGGAAVAFGNGGIASYGQGGRAGFAYVPPLYGTYNCYRLLDDDPELARVRSFLREPIVASVPDWHAQAANEDQPPEWADLINRRLVPQLAEIVPAAFRALSYGFAPFMKVWSRDKGEFYCKLVPKLPEWTRIYIDREKLTYSGASFDGQSMLNPLPPNQTWLCINDPEALNLYGHSRHDAAYDAYCRQQAVYIDLVKLRSKLSGILPVVHYAPGQSPNPFNTSQMVDNSFIAQLILSELQNGSGVAIPSQGFNSKAIQENPALSKIGLWVVEFQDNGNLSAAEAGYVEESKYWDVKKCRAWQVSERAVFEGEHGTKAEAGVHSDSSVIGSETIANMIAMQLTSGRPTMGVPGVVDELLLYNFGKEAVGQVRLVAPPLSDAKIQTKLTVFDNLISAQNTDLTLPILDMIEAPDLLKGLGFKLKPGAKLDIGAIQKKTDEAKKQAADLQAQKMKGIGGAKGAAGPDGEQDDEELQMSRNLLMSRDAIEGDLPNGVNHAPDGFNLPPT